MSRGKSAMPSDEAVEALTVAASLPVRGCFVEGVGDCGGTHTDCYYREILTSALPVIRADVANEIAAWVEERSGSALANWIRREFGAAS